MSQKIKIFYSILFVLVLGFIILNRSIIIHAQEEGETDPNQPMIDMFFCATIGLCDGIYINAPPPSRDYPNIPPDPPRQPPDPDSVGFSCPIQNSQGILCSSSLTPIAGVSCQHCAGNYPRMDVCPPIKPYFGTEFAIDVKARAGDPIIFPYIDGHEIEWKFQAGHSKDYIQKFSGVQTVGTNGSNKTFWLQLHHAIFGKNGKSGDIAANVCTTNCFSGASPHVHIQIMPGTLISGRSNNWYDAAKVMRCP